MTATTNRENTDLTLIRGNDETPLFTFYTSSALTTVVNLTGATITMQARKEMDSPDTLFSVTAADSTFGSVYASGIVGVRIPKASMDTLTNRCVYELRSVLSGVTTTLARGVINVVKNVVRP